LQTRNFTLFDCIADRYDIFNGISSFGFDIYWRRKLANHLKNLKQFKVLDVAVGTADVLLTLFKCNCDISAAVGIDTSAKMLAKAKEKVIRMNLTEKIELLYDDAANMSFADYEFDAITCAFGIRNFTNPDMCLKQMFRVLKPAGKLLILEFSSPQNSVLKALYRIYLKYCIPVLGKIITGNFSAYFYLSKTILSFPSASDFCSRLQNTGFTNISAIQLTFGAVTLYLAEKPLST
jgi:demethylmenaquinone methyltransferase/2-methoxy-6-polyprenyl-1,4-benzoquinol methylase